TEALKTDKKWKWSDEMEEEFKLVKEELRNMRALKIPDYTKGFRLRTDACDTGLGAVLLQTNKEGKWIPIQWASKKLTPTERRYTITEKEMLAVVWGIEKFEYELRGRRFELMTDHRALEEIRNKPYFNNNRVNRWIERIQEYDFRVQYVKGELMGDADALSRQFQEEDREETKKKELSKQMEGKILKHTIINEGKEYWKFDNGTQKEIPKIEERDRIIRGIHIKLNHRGVKGTHYQLKQDYYWPGMKEMVTKILKECEICQVANRKTKGGVEFVTSVRKGEKFAIDIMEIGEPKKRVLIGIDYFTRYLYAKILEERTTEKVIAALEEWFSVDEVPECIISDNAKEFMSAEFRKWCSMNEVEHRKVSVEAHGSNGRIERAIRTIRDSVFKQSTNGVIETEVAVKSAVNIYNKTYHSGLRCTPNEAIKDCKTNTEIKWENSSMGDYAKNFVKRTREKFIVGQIVRIAKRENLGNNSKRDSGRFTRKGVITDVCEKDSYIVKTEG
ncbi:Transposon Tf2-9 polyprotein, partial [Nosema granulosis]